MPKPKITYQDIAPTAKVESSLTFADKAFYADLEELKLDTIPDISHFVNLEQNYWVLDGDYDFFPEETYNEYHWGLVGTLISDERGVFSEPPTLDIAILEEQTAPGFTFHFDMYKNRWCKEVELIYMNNDTVIHDETFYPDAPIYCCEAKVSGFNRLIIKFIATNTPYSRVRVNAFFFGVIREFNTDELMSLSVLEEMNPITEELSINVAEFEIRTNENISYMFTRMQPLTIRYGNDIMGMFFIDSTEKIGRSYHGISAVDAIGVLNNFTFLGGMYKDKNVGELVNEIIFPTYRTYEIDEELASKSVSGYLPISSCRDALMQIAFAIGAVIDTSRSELITIKKLQDQTNVKDYTENNTHADGSINISPRVTEVQLTTHNYSIQTDNENELLKTNLAKGTYNIRNTSPYANYKVTGATIIDSDVNYIDISVTTPGEVIIKANPYLDSTVMHSRIAAEKKMYDVDNIKQVNGCTLVSEANVDEVMDRVFDYCIRVESAENVLILEDTQVGDAVKMPTTDLNEITGTIVSNKLSFGSKLRGEVTVLKL